MHRLFVAIRPPAAIRSVLLGAMGGISGARWQSEDQLHLTLRFIGEVDRHRAGDIHAALGESISAVRIALNGIGHFDRRGWPDAVWRGSAATSRCARSTRSRSALVRSASTRISAPSCRISRWRAQAQLRPARQSNRGAAPRQPPVHGRSFALFESDLTPTARSIRSRTLFARLKSALPVSRRPGDWHSRPVEPM